MNRTKWIPLLGLALLGSSTLMAQESRAERRKSRNQQSEIVEDEKKGIPTDSLLEPIPNNRWLFADKVEKAIRALDAKDGLVDNRVELSDAVKSRLLTQAFIVDPAKLRILIENAPVPHPKKIGYHRALQSKLESLKGLNFEAIDAIYYRQLMINFYNMMVADIEGDLLSFAKANPTLQSLDNIESFDNNKEAKAHLYKTVGTKYPLEMLDRLDRFAAEPYADDIIAAAAKLAPRQIMTYAAPNSKYRWVIARNQDKTVKTIVDIVDRSESRFKVLQFLNQIQSGERSIAEVDKLVKDDDTYYSSLVALKISGKALSPAEIESEIANRSLLYIRKVNELHDAQDAVRFRSVERFSPEEYYFMLLGGETNEIYTSSYLGIFKRMMAKMNGESGYSLLERVKMSNFRTFIRMAAGYNTIEQFLGTMTEEEKVRLMTDFVAGLEQGSREDLKDAVDVADAFGSIKSETLKEFLQDKVRENYERVYADKRLKRSEQEKGLIIYGLLASIFNSSTDPEALQNAVENIPPINYVDINSLKNVNGEVVAQVFFYGDQDGKDSYRYFLNNFRNNKWRIDESNPHWTKIHSVEGSPVVYYANKPHDEPQDEVAQNKLADYFKSNNITPVVVIHRGHSYHLEGSLKSLTPAVKVVMLGSCGGFHNLSNVLNKAPDANIISTKQIGSFMVNDPLIRTMNDYFTAGKNLDWQLLWKDMENYFSNRSAREKELFSDYIPPNKNLGAIFIKAYRSIEMANQS